MVFHQNSVRFWLTLCDSLTTRSKGQYERHFTKWSFRKNTNDKHWKIVSYKLAKRKRDGKDSNVYYHNQLLPPKKVCNEVSRHGYMTTSERLRSDRGIISMHEILGVNADGRLHSPVPNNSARLPDPHSYSKFRI